MENNIRKYSLILLVLGCALLFGAVNPEYVRSQFNDAVDVFCAGDYTLAHNKFQSLYIDTPGTPYYSITSFMLALSSYRSGDYQASANEFEAFIRDFPADDKAGVARIYAGHSLYFLNNYQQAARAYLLGFETSETNSQAAQVCRKSAENLLWGYLPLDQLEILSQHLEGQSKQIVDYMRVKRHLALGQYARAMDIIERSMAVYPQGIYTDSLRVQSNRIRKQLEENISIAVFVPITGMYSSYGNSLLNGVKLAFKQYKKSSGKKINLIIEDTNADPLVASVAAREVISGHALVATIGPLLSEVAVPLGVISDSYRIPIISPTAAKDDLAKLSPFMFQISTPPSISAKRIAEYAVKVKMINRFSLLAPSDNTGREAATQFALKVEELGGEIVSSAYYSRETIDFSIHMQELKKPYLENMQYQVTEAETTDYRFYKPNGELRAENEWIVDVPGLFIPAYYEDLISVLPQIPFNYIDAQILGVNGWLISELTDEMDGSYLDSAIVVPDNFWVDEDAQAFSSFSRNFKREYGESPDRVAASGYDAAQLICEGISQGAITPDQLRDYLAGVYSYQGAAGKISFDIYGTNKEVSLIQFDRKVPKSIEWNDYGR